MRHDREDQGSWSLVDPATKETILDLTLEFSEGFLLGLQEAAAFDRWLAILRSARCSAHAVYLTTSYPHDHLLVTGLRISIRRRHEKPNRYRLSVFGIPCWPPRQPQRLRNPNIKNLPKPLPLIPRKKVPSRFPNVPTRFQPESVQRNGRASHNSRDSRHSRHFVTPQWRAFTLDLTEQHPLNAHSCEAKTPRAHWRSSICLETDDNHTMAIGSPVRMPFPPSTT